MKDLLDLSTIEDTVRAAKIVACRYYELTGKPLGITGEVGEHQAAAILGLKLEPARQSGYDARALDGRRMQIKARCVPKHAKSKNSGQRVGSIRLDHPWDAVVLLLMDHEFEPLEAFEASREAVVAALQAPGSKARNERGALAVAKFKSIGRQVWARAQPTPPKGENLSLPG